MGILLAPVGTLFPFLPSKLANPKKRTLMIWPRGSPNPKP